MNISEIYKTLVGSISKPLVYGLPAIASIGVAYPLYIYNYHQYVNSLISKAYNYADAAYHANLLESRTRTLEVINTILEWGPIVEEEYSSHGGPPPLSFLFHHEDSEDSSSDEEDEIMSSFVRKTTTYDDRTEELCIEKLYFCNDEDCRTHRYREHFETDNSRMTFEDYASQYVLSHNPLSLLLYGLVIFPSTLYILPLVFIPVAYIATDSIINYYGYENLINDLENALSLNGLLFEGDAIGIFDSEYWA